MRAYVYLCLGAMWQRVGVDSVAEVGQSGESSGESGHATGCQLEGPQREGCGEQSEYEQQGWDV